MVQARPVKDPEQVVVWDAVRDKVEAEWAVHLLQDRAEIVYAQAVALQPLMLPDNLAIKEVVQNVEQK
jgi:hypothetical protein